jgi:predicted nucleotidyltransferase
MQRAQALRLLRKHKPTLSKRFDVSSLALIGSVARNEASDNSDVDIMVWFDGPTTARHFFGTQLYLEEVLGREVDLMTEKSLREGLHPYVEREMISV